MSGTEAPALPAYAPLVTPVAPGSRFRDVTQLEECGLLGGYRRELGWDRGRTLGARTAVGPEYPD
ncbi:hypothetical protein GTZ89_28650 [Streptomyces sp. SID8382]|uniref:hypothetical protein n=1 Tax=Streptomyces malaysiensis TaxID=92644 RepID=UPI000C2BF882|nr:MULTISPECIES: hypothetical protein [unclassified Streptomyces]AUA08551.1 hypothetical protein CFP59_00637 [Streptomyces sp. M56]MYX59504.1 hypothetical protein [Streptomyces sp. SID8382]